MEAAVVAASRNLKRHGSRRASLRSMNSGRQLSLRSRGSIRRSSLGQIDSEVLLIDNAKDQDEAVKEIAGKAILDSKRQGNDSMTKLNANGSWGEIRLIATSEQLFLLSLRGNQVAKYEIVDCISLHEILGIEQYDPWESPDDSRTASSANFMRSATTKELEQLKHSPQAVSAFMIRTKEGGFNSGKKYVFSTGSTDFRKDWIDTLTKESAHAGKVFERRNRITTFQANAKWLYHSLPCQLFMVCSITANFIISLMRAEIGDDTQSCATNVAVTSNQTTSALQNLYMRSTYDGLDVFFTVLFSADLLLNFCAHAFWPFFDSRYNLFDLMVMGVSIGILFVSPETNGMVKQLRILRVFRLLRVVGRIGQFRQIVNAISSAIAPALQALLVGLIVVSIYSAIGTQYFGVENPQGFCDFYHSFYTMFGVIAYSQPDNINAFDDSGSVRVGPIIFIYSYVVIVVFVLLQVVVAVLLDSFYRAREADKQKEAQEDAARSGFAADRDHPLEPLLEKLAVTFDTAEGLNHRLDVLFSKLDADNKGELSYGEVAEGLYKFTDARFRPGASRLTVEDFDHMVGGGGGGGGADPFDDGAAACRSSHTMTQERFRTAITRRLRQHVQRGLADALYNPNLDAGTAALVTTMKLALVELDGVYKDVGALRAGVGRQLAEVNSMLDDMLLDEASFDV